MAAHSPGSDPTFDAVVDAETIRTVVDFADALVDECRLELDRDGLRIRAMDPATVAMIDLELSADAFDAYESGEGQLGLDLDRLGDVVGMADRDQSVRFALDPERNALSIEVDDLEYTLALLDPDAIRSPPDPSGMDAEFTATVALEGTDVDRSLRAADMVSNHVALAVETDDDAVFRVEAEGDTDDVTLSLGEADLLAFDPGDARSLFSLDYLTAIDRAIAGRPRVDLRFGTETPLEVRSAFADGAGSVSYLVSPRLRVA